ncbi:MAG TPA: hypothetical protein VH621_01950 [Nitrososphaera sp.]|jgi:hypothetical protein
MGVNFRRLMRAFKSRLLPETLKVYQIGYETMSESSVEIKLKIAAIVQIPKPLTTYSVQPVKYDPNSVMVTLQEYGNLSDKEDPMFGALHISMTHANQINLRVGDVVTLRLSKP